jgi:hypothetical protein
MRGNRRRGRDIVDGFRQCLDDERYLDVEA